MRFVETACIATALSPELALQEATICQAVFGSARTEHVLHTDCYPTDAEFARVILAKVRREQQYLFWQTGLLVSVLNHAEDFMDTVVEYSQSMSQVWIADPAMTIANGTVIMGTYFHADSEQIYMAHMFSKPLANEEPWVEWYRPYIWGQVVEDKGQAEALAVYTWLQQPYVAQAKAIQHSRQVRRAAERKGETLGNISVIEFRKPEGTRSTKPEPSEKTRELHCCFERAGYTRSQPYGPKNSLRRIQWIAPTFVGDPTKPFKPKGRKIYKVTR
jgi:hypothetical protein